MAKLSDQIIDKQSGQRVEARVQVLSSGGTFLHPREALLKVGPGLPFFYCDGAFEVDAPRGVTRILVERGTEYAPVQMELDLAARGVTTPRKIARTAMRRSTRPRLKSPTMT